MLVEEIFNIRFYPELKEYVEETNLYSAKVVKVNPQDSKVFPIIPVKLLPVTNKYNNLSYGEETYSFGIEIDIYTIDTTIENERVSKKTICDDLTKLIVEYIKNNYHLTVKVTHDVPNLDINVYRNLIRLSGTLDTKYGDNNLVIYPNY
jgi:hypothetical protein